MFVSTVPLNIKTIIAIINIKTITIIVSQTDVCVSVFFCSGVVVVSV